MIKQTQIKKWIWIGICLIILRFPVFSETVIKRIDAISNYQQITPGTPFSLLVEIELEDGWHLYWKNPGDTGLETRFIWELPNGIRLVREEWPIPIQFYIPMGPQEPPLVSFGYEKKWGVVFDFIWDPSIGKSTIEDLILRLKISWLGCKINCVPGHTDLLIHLKVGDVTIVHKENQKRITDLSSEFPLPWDSSLVSRIIYEDGVWKWEFSREKSFIHAFFFPFTPNVFQYEGIRYQAPYLILPLKNPLLDPTYLSGILVIESQMGKKGYKIDQQVLSTLPIDQDKRYLKTNQNTRSFLWMMVAGFLGGILLNLMPCVLPILSIKILHFFEHAKHGRLSVIFHGILYALGILVSFWGFAFVIIVLKQSLTNLGWGFHLQSVPFVIFLTILLFICALNFLGVFEFGSSLGGLGSKIGQQSAWLNSFLSGMLATIVATPCTAPFMGSAMSFAFTQPPLGILIIFSCLGLGMASPYLGLTLLPNLQKVIPRPGPWMVILKESMGFLLLISVIGLIYVLLPRLSPESMAIFLIAIWLIGVGCWLMGKVSHPVVEGKNRLIGWILVILFIGGGIWLSFRSPSFFRSTITWEPFSPERLISLRKDQKPVFISFEASWCTSCKTNKLAFNAQVEKVLLQKGVTLFRADFSNYDPIVGEWLVKFGRRSVPLYVYYPPGESQDPFILPEILTPSILLDFLNR